MKTNRRLFLTGAAATAGAAITGAAHAQNLLNGFINAPRRGAWSDRFDADVNPEGDVVSNLPILSAQTLSYTQQAVNSYSQIVQNGGWPMVPEGKKLQLGVVDPAVEALRRRLMITGDLPLDAGMSQAFDSYVDAALKFFQARHGIPRDGVTGKFTYAALNVPAEMRLGQLQTNVARLQSKAGPLGDRFVMVNIPATQIEAVENGRVVLRNKAIVGKVTRQSPVLSSKINEIIINPYWNAPQSIVRKDIIPLMRKDPEYLSKMNIHILGPDGQEVDPMSIDWSTDEAVGLRFRQDPGELNAMASVKINFPNQYSVYMHDTPQQALFRDEDRFYSSGCVRVQNVRDLVTWLLRDTPGWDRQRFEHDIKTVENESVPLAVPVPVYFVYITAWASPGNVVHFRDDIYGRDGAGELQMSNAL